MTCWIVLFFTAITRRGDQQPSNGTKPEEANINIFIDMHPVEKISLGTHWPHPLWVITPGRIRRLTPDLAEGRHWKAAALLLYMLFSVCSKSQNWGDFVGVLRCTVANGQGLVDTGSWEFLFTKPSQKGRWGTAGGCFFFTAWSAVGSSSKQAPVNVTQHGVLLNKRDTTGKPQKLGNIPSWRVLL